MNVRGTQEGPKAQEAQARSPKQDAKREGPKASKASRSTRNAKQAQETSALVVEKLVGKNKSRMCAMKCWQQKPGSRVRTAGYKVYILGHPAGFVCNTCAQMWLQTWDEVLRD